MAKLSRPRHGSLQFWPRKRAEKALHRVNWATISGEGILGYIVYKVGMATAVVKDLTDKSMTQNKKIFLPVTILEAPSMKVASIRFYKNNRVVKECIVSSDKELKKKISIPKQAPVLEKPKEYDDVRLIVYSLANQTNFRKTPDLIEIAISAKDKFEFAKSLVGKEITPKDFSSYSLVDARGLTKGKGLEGPVPRFGLNLKQHKTEKGVRRPGSLAPWHPARVTFRTPQAGQLGMFSRIIYNLKVVGAGKISEKNIHSGTGFKHFGKINSSYILVKGSVQGPPKRQLLLTPSVRPKKLTGKTKYEFQEIVA